MGEKEKDDIMHGWLSHVNLMQTTSCESPYQFISFTRDTFGWELRGRVAIASGPVLGKSFLFRHSIAHKRGGGPDGNEDAQPPPSKVV